MAIKNPQTWTRVKRIELRSFANLIGNEAMKHINSWPKTGEGRSIKAITEDITRNLDGHQLHSNIELNFRDLLNTTEGLRKISANEFFIANMANSEYRDKYSKVSFAVGDRLNQIIADVDKFIADYRASLPPPASAAEIAAIQVTEMVPEQKIGPVKFELNNNILRVAHQAAHTNEPDTRNAEVARRELLSNANQIIEFLKQSNQDARLISTIEDMRDRVKKKRDIIQLGIAAISCQIICDRFEEELPNLWAAKLQGFAISIGMYVAQFPEWVRFSENAALADFTLRDVAKLFDTGSKLAEELRNVAVLVDPEVPKTLSFLLEAIRDPRRAKQRTVFAAIRTIENLVAVVIRGFGKILGAAHSGVIEGTKKAVTIVTVSGLLLAAANAAIEISPAAGRVLQTSWLGKAGKLIKESFKDID